mmetsp:Transcript_49911/g.106962  ORF Transcript_49911/g.106962 Transcript_49911/m.106962 type:complete len:259 (-) Transcript_49911:310-1086(-)
MGFLRAAQCQWNCHRKNCRHRDRTCARKHSILGPLLWLATILKRTHARSQAENGEHGGEFHSSRSTVHYADKLGRLLARVLGVGPRRGNDNLRQEEDHCQDHCAHHSWCGGRKFGHVRDPRRRIHVNACDDTCKAAIQTKHNNVTSNGQGDQKVRVPVCCVLCGLLQIASAWLQGHRLASQQRDEQDNQCAQHHRKRNKVHAALHPHLRLILPVRQKLHAQAACNEEHAQHGPISQSLRRRTQTRLHLTLRRFTQLMV